MLFVFPFSGNYINASNTLITENMVKAILVEIWGTSRLAKILMEFEYQVRRA